MPKIYVTDREGNEHVLEAETGLSLMELLRDLDDGGVEALCGGMCSCATCHVFVEAEWLDKVPLRQDDELELVESTECFQNDNSRLSCQIQITEELDGLRLTIAPEE
jgi:2Fe-2S ferredoxin